MRELVYLVAVSLDGRIAAPDGDFSAFPVEGDHIDMLVREHPQTLSALGLRQLGLAPDPEPRTFGAVVMGWETYAVGLPYGAASPYPYLEQVVFTRRHRDHLVPDDVRLTDADPVAEVRRLKEQPGLPIWLCGGGALAGALAEEVDRLVLKVNPVVLGEGVPLFGPGGASGGHDPRAFALTASTPYRSGVVVNDYRRVRAGAPAR